MSRTLLHAIARKAESVTPDADLLARFVRDRDQSAFEELVKRHGPLVWAVCRQLLPDHADAEDAFQAVFLALVRSAPSIRDGAAVPAWLHGVAVRVATRAKRALARRKKRERSAALPEADSSVSAGAWAALMRAAHEEVQKLPEAERVAFVMCDLEGVSQPDAAARLGWPLGSVSGRLCKARQRLLDRLAARGIAPAAAVGIGFTAGGASALPERLFAAVKVFPGAPGAASAVAQWLARGLTEGLSMRMKMLATATVLVAAVGLTGGTALLSQGSAQPPDVVKEVQDLTGGLGVQDPLSGGGAPGGSAGGGASGFPGSGGGPPPGLGAGSPPAGGAPGGLSGAPPGMGAPLGGLRSSGMPSPGGAGLPDTGVQYRFIDIKSDRKAFESTITKHGKEGWEFCGSERFGQAELTLVFKKVKGPSVNFGAPPGAGGRFGFGAPGAGGRFEFGPMGADNTGSGRSGAGGGFGAGGGTNNPSDGERSGRGGRGGEGGFGPAGGSGFPGAGSPEGGGFGKGFGGAGGDDPFGGPGSGRPGRAPDAGQSDGGSDNLYKVQLKNTNANDMVKALQKQFPKGLRVVADQRTNAVVVSGEPDTIKSVLKVIGDLDARGAKPGAGGMPGPVGAGGTPSGAAPANRITVVSLKHASVEQLESALMGLFKNAEIIADARSNKLIIRTDPQTLAEMLELVEQLDTEAPKRK